MDQRFSSAKETIKKAASELQSLVVQESFKERIETICAELDKAEFRVAIIGMMNDGKSTFLNGFLRRPNFMVMDVNVCTAAVGALKFGHPESTSAGRAEVTFWSLEEMQQRVDIVKKRLEFGRKFAARAVSGNDPSPVSSNGMDGGWIEDGPFSDPISDAQWLVDVAAKMDSPLWQEWAGRKTIVDSLDAQSLAPYLAREGELALLVKTSYILLPIDPFKQPCSILDTPGINDPDRYRSELTLNAMAGMHAYIMVISSTSGVTETHANVLKALQGLRRERLVVVLSKIDQLNTADDVAKVVNKTRADLRRLWNEESDTPIVVANAYFSGDETWAREDKKSVRRKAEAWLRDNVGEYLGNPELQVENPETMDVPTLREHLYRASNLRAVHATVEDVIMQAQGDEILRCAVGNLLDLSQQAADLEHERAKQTQLTLNLAGEGLERLRQQLAMNDERRQRISEHKELLKRRLEDAREACRDNWNSASKFQDALWETGRNWIKETKRGACEDWFLWAHLDYDSKPLVDDVKRLIHERGSEAARGISGILKQHHDSLHRLIGQYDDLREIHLEEPPPTEAPNVDLGHFGYFRDTIRANPLNAKQKVKDIFEGNALERFNRYFPGIVGDYQSHLNRVSESVINSWTQKVNQACGTLDRLIDDQTAQIQQLLQDGSPEERERHLEALRDTVRQAEERAASITAHRESLESLHPKVASL